MYPICHLSSELAVNFQSVQLSARPREPYRLATRRLVHNNGDGQNGHTQAAEARLVWNDTDSVYWSRLERTDVAARPVQSVSG